MNPLPANQTLDAYFLEARCKLLDIAAILDRIARGTGGNGVREDPRLAKIRESLDVLKEPGTERAERIQQIFSLDYDAAWKIPQPRY
jgi:hypothetical protein